MIKDLTQEQKHILLEEGTESAGRKGTADQRKKEPAREKTEGLTPKVGRDGIRERGQPQNPRLSCIDRGVRIECDLSSRGSRTRGKGAGGLEAGGAGTGDQGPGDVSNDKGQEGSGGTKTTTKFKIDLG